MTGRAHPWDHAAIPAHDATHPNGDATGDAVPAPADLPAGGRGRPATPGPSAGPPRGNPPFRRRRDDRVLAGVASGFAAAYGVDPFVVRTALVVLSLAGGLGVVLYLVGLLVAGDPDGAEESGPTAGAVPIDPRRNLAVGCLAGGLLLACRGVGLWPG